MKKVLIVIIGIIVLVFLVSFLHIDQTEWSLKEKEYNLGIPLKITNGTIVEIEKQVRRVIPDAYSSSYLGEIKFVSKSKEGFETFIDGELEFIYCDNLGNLNGFYKYDRYALCEINVNLKQKVITKMKIYGNNQIGGLKEIEQYPDINELRKSIYAYCENCNWSQYTITRCFINILNADIVMSSFTVELSAEKPKQICGKIVKRNDEYIFREK